MGNRTTCISLSEERSDRLNALVRNLDQKNFKNYGIHATDNMITIIDWDSFDDTLPHDEISMGPSDLVEFCKFILDANDNHEAEEPKEKR